MKRRLITILSLLIVIALSFGVLAACQNGLTTEQLDTLYKEFSKLHKNDATETPKSYYVDGKVFYINDKSEEISANVQWTIEGTTVVKVSAETNSLGQYQIIIPDEVATAIDYKLVGTLVDEEGKAYAREDGSLYSLELPKTVPATKGKGTEADPYSVTSALAEFATIPANGWSTDKIYVTGIVITAPSYNETHQSYTFDIADSKDATKKIQIYSGSLASGIAKVCQNDTVVVNGFYCNYNGNNPEIAGAKDKDYPVVISRTIGTSSISVLSGDNADVTLSKTSGENGTTFTFTVTSKNNAEISSVKVNNVEVTAVDGTYTGTIEGDTTVSVVAIIPTIEEQTTTVNLATEFETYSKDWGIGYGSRTLDSAILKVDSVVLTLVLSSGSKQANTISDIPVLAAKGGQMQYATLTVSGCQINEITFNLREWSSVKTFKTLCLEYTTDGTNWEMVQGVGFVDSSPEQAVAGYLTLKAEYLPSSVTAVRLAYTSEYVYNGSASNQQVGLAGFTVKTGPVTVDNSEARIGATKYDTLAAAIEAAQANDTIVLQKDVVVTSTIAIAKQITLNLNGKTISNTADLYNAENQNWSIISVREGGKLTIEGNGKILAGAEAHNYALDVNAEGAELVIKNGEYVGNTHSVYANLGSVTIEGGKYAINAAEGNAVVLNKKDGEAKATIAVKAGSFVNYDPANFLAEGYIAKSKTEGEGEAQVTIWTVEVAAPTTEHAGTAADPYTVADAKKWAEYLNGAGSTDPVYVTGIVSGAIDDGKTANTYKFNVVTAAGDEVVCTMYYVTATAKPQEGDLVVVKGTLKLYKGVAEIDQGGIIVSVNGVDTGLDGGETPTPTPSTVVSNVDKVTAPAAETAYLITIDQEKLSTPTQIYLIAEMGGYYVKTNKDQIAAVKYYVEVVEGGYKIYRLEGETKKYLGVTTNDTHVNVSLNQETVWTIDADGIHVTLGEGDAAKVWYLGTKGTYETVGMYTDSADVCKSYLGTIKEGKDVATITATVTPSDKANVQLSKTSGKAGETFTISVVPVEGYQVASVKVNGKVISLVEGVYSAIIDSLKMNVEVIVEDSSVQKVGGTATMQYVKGSGTTNIGKDGVTEASVGLDGTIFTVTSNTGAGSNQAGLNNDGTIRLYYGAAGDGCSITIEVAAGYKITSITVKAKAAKETVNMQIGNGEAKTLDTTSSETQVEVNGSSITIKNVNTSNVQIYIESIVIVYDVA